MARRAKGHTVSSKERDDRIGGDRRRPRTGSADQEVHELARKVDIVLKELRQLRAALEANRVIRPRPPKPLGTSRPAGG
jgi:hypothetical protein